jgi:hypothetical protein
MKIEIDDVLCDKIFVERFVETIESLRESIARLVSRDISKLEKWEVQDLKDQTKTLEHMEAVYEYFVGMPYKKP